MRADEESFKLLEVVKGFVLYIKDSESHNIYELYGFLKPNFF